MSHLQSSANGMALKASTELIFHPDFNLKKSGDVILQSSDNTCFYFCLAHLAALSTFFSTLPPPTNVDLTNGTAIIPFSDTPSAALLLSVQALQSTVLPGTYRISAERFESRPSEAIRDIVDAAIWARTFDIPHLFALLFHSIRDVQSHHIYPFLVFVIKALCGVDKEIAAAGQATLTHDLSTVPNLIVESLKVHAPKEWSRLRNLHIRYAAGPARFHRMFPIDLSDPETRHKGCSMDRGCQVTSAERKIAAQHTVEGILAAGKEIVELVCPWCTRPQNIQWGKRMEWFRAFALEYICSQEDRVFGLDVQ